MVRKKQALIGYHGTLDLSQHAKEILESHNVSDIVGSLTFRSNPLVIHCAKKLGVKFLIRGNVALVDYDPDKFTGIGRGAECIEMSDFKHVHPKLVDILYGDDNIEGIARRLFEENKKVFERLDVT